MTRYALAAALILAAAPVMAAHCPQDMAKIDAALAASSAELSEEDLAQVKELRAKGEELHEAGDHAASVEELGKAMEILGIE
jgi:chromosome segregation and condensation protein ScpB